MGEFTEKISKLSNSEMEEIWKKITNYQVEYIDDFLTELKVRGIRDQYYLTNHTLMDLFSKVKNSENIEFLNTLIEQRGLSGSVSSYVEKNVKKKVNYTISTAGIAILIVVIIKLLARNAGNEHRENQQNNEFRNEIINQQIQESKENKEQIYQRISEEISNELFEPGGQLRNELDQIKSMHQKKINEGYERNKVGKEQVINSYYSDMKERYFTKMDSILYQSYSKGLPQEVKDKIASQYKSELRQIIK